MTPSLTIYLNVNKARKNGQSAVAGTVLFSFTSPAQILPDEPWEVVGWIGSVTANIGSA
jgi:hypothetical protein